MASKLPTLLLPAYDLRLKPKYRDFAEALYQLNKYRREAMTREAVDKLYVTAVRETYPHNKGKQDELIEQINSRKYARFWEGFEKDGRKPLGLPDPFRGTKTWGTFMIKGTKVSLPICDGELIKFDYIQFASTLLPRVNPDLTCTKEIVDEAWIMTIERSPAFKGVPIRVKKIALAKAKTGVVKQYWKGRSVEEEV